MKKALMNKLWEALVSVLPVAALVLLLSFTPFAPLSWLQRAVFAVSALLLVLGIGLFNLGADLAMTPMGRHIGEGPAKSNKLGALVCICFLMGVLITVAEPDLSVLAGQISAVINPTLLIATVGVGVGLFLALAIIRIVTRTDLTALLLFFYMLLFAFASLLISSGGQPYLPLAFDSGGVTTGPITVPFIMALGIGIAQSIGGRDAGQNSFGLIALCSAGPVLAVLLLSLSAGGGEILKGRGTAPLEAEEVFKIKVQPEKEIVMLLVPHEIKDDVLREIYRSAGPDSDSQGFTFSMPVDRTLGLNDFSEKK